MAPFLLPYLEAATPYGNHALTAVAVIFVALAGSFAVAPIFDRGAGLGL